MELIWKPSASDIIRLQRFIAEAQREPFVQARARRNLAPTKREVSRPAFWHALVGALLTTQQKSGPESAVARFMRARPFPLAYPLCFSQLKVDMFVTRTLSAFGGIRRSTRIGEELAANLTMLEDGLWREVLNRLNSLRPLAPQQKEMQAAEFLDDKFMGLGPKQSRNLLQGLGLTRYEVPIDSRLTKWLNEFGFPLHLSATGLADRDYYRLVSQGIQELCAAADISPCVLDAAVFASFDNGRWNAANMEDWGYDGA